MSLFRFTLVVVANCVVTSQAFGQPESFTRQNDSGVFVTSIQCAGGEVDFDQAAGDILVNVGTIASGSDTTGLGSSFAQGTGMVQAMNLTPVGANTFVPTVDTTLMQSDIVTATAPKSASSGGAICDINEARSNGIFALDEAAASGFLQGSMYLFGDIGGTETGDGVYNGDGFVQASVGTFFVEAAYFDSTGLWGVDVNLPGVTDSFFTSSLNHFFNFVIPSSLSSVNLSAISSAMPSAFTTMSFPREDGTAQGQVALSASDWALFTPTSAPPLDGDFDGDGDVDGSDFLALQRGFGESMGATLSQGDADHDGNVNSTDLSLWASNFGTVNSALSSAVSTVPEPTTFSIVLAAIPFLFFVRIRFTSDEWKAFCG